MKIEKLRTLLPMVLVTALGAGTTLAQTAPAGKSRLSYYFPAGKTELDKVIDTDICIYGGNSSGVVAALQASKMGKRAVVLEPSEHVGGLSSGGLGETDIGNKAAIGGLAHDFYRRVGKKYGLEEEWRFEPHIAEAVFKEMLVEAGAPVYYREFLKSVEKRGGKIISLTCESGLKVRAKIFIDASYEGDLMAKSGVKYHVGRESNAVYGETLNGVQVQNGHQFDRAVDPYVVEGDPKSGLLPGVNAMAPGDTGTGDQKIQAYNFRLCLTNDPGNRIPFEKPVGYDPQQYILLGRYLKAGWPESEVFRKFDPIHSSFIVNETVSSTFTTDDLIDSAGLLGKFKRGEGPLTSFLKAQFSPDFLTVLQAYTVAGPVPDASKMALLKELNRVVNAGSLYTPELFSKVNLTASTRSLLADNPQGAALASLNKALLLDAYSKELGTKKYLKVDKNNHGAFSTDYIGGNYGYPEGDYVAREKIFQAHVLYQKGLMWFLGNDPSVPESIRARWSQWGLAKDEFVATGGWPHQLYVREARRMISDYVMTESDCVGKTKASDPIGLAAYTMDSHNTQRFVKDGRVWNEGNVQVQGFSPYPISYRAIVPKKGECTNLFVPVCLAASHIAYGSIRMEPVFMILGQSAASAAALAIDGDGVVQDVTYPKLREVLEAEQQILAWNAPKPAVAAIENVGQNAQGSPAMLNAFFKKLKAGEKQTVVVYGTSLTAGGAWVGMMKSWFEQQFPGKVDFYNGGISGQNSDEGVKQLQAKVLEHRPNLVFIEFAINDSHVRFKMPVEQGAANLDFMVKALREQNPKVAVVLQTMSVPWDAPNGNRSFSDRPQLGAFYDNYRNYAKLHEVLLIDNTPDWQRLKDTDPEKYHTLLVDGLHPNVQGYAVVTWPSVKANLERALNTP